MANEPLQPALPKLPNLANTHVLVVGDLMVDRYWHGAADRVSQEAPVPVVAIESVEERPGGAANVALNVVALGAGCTLIGVVGDDPAGTRLEATLQAAGVRCEFVRAKRFETITKIRIMGQGQQMLRADFESQVPTAAARAVVERLQQCLSVGTDAVVIEDYEKGTIDDAQALISLCGELPVVVDPKNKPIEAFRGARLVKPNEVELRQWLTPWPSETDLPEQLEALRAANQIDSIVVTRGARGMLVADGSAAPLQLPARQADVFDVTGAGDTVAATLAACLAAEMPLRAAARLANLAASLVVAKAGTAAIAAPELRALIDAEERSDRGLLNNSQLLQFAERARAAGQRIVFTNGCFDILHAGHVAYLQEARELGDRLVVAINDDAAVTRLKGAGRPVNTLARRAQVLAALAVVDWVVAFSEDTPERLLAELQPELLVKGGDYTPETVVGAEVVKGYGGEVRVLSLVEAISTSGIVERLRGE